MISKRKYYIIIPARYGSTTIKEKNLLKLGKYNLVRLAIKYACQFKFIDKIILTSDSNKILKYANKSKIIKDRRPKKLSGKYSKTVDTINYIIKKYHIKKNDIIFILEPTSPLRIKNDILGVKKYLERKNIFSVCTFAESPIMLDRLWFKKNNKMISLSKKDQNLPRQKQKKYFHAVGNVVGVKVKQSIIKELISKKTHFVLTNNEHSIDIDNKNDYALVKTLFKKNEFKK